MGDTDYDRTVTQNKKVLIDEKKVGHYVVSV